jgi:hypothetical protein
VFRHEKGRVKVKMEALVSRLEKVGLNPRSYSGRFMYGKRCVSVSVDFLSELGKGTPKGYKVDNLGLGYVAYWPEVEWTGYDPEDDEGEE